MAREEYDREVAARRDAEFEMIRLKNQMKEQVARLGTLDDAQKKQELLARRSTDLRKSVVGIEKELSKIKVERDMTIAEIEELALLPKSNDDVSLAPERLSVALNSRILNIKEEYRGDLESLAAQRDSLKQEIDELRQAKDLYNEESTALIKRNAGLADAITEAARMLDAVKAELAQAQHQLLTSNARKEKNLSPHHRTASPSLNSSAGSTGTNGAGKELLAPSLPASRNLPSTPTPPIDEQPTAFIAEKVENVIPLATARKFK